MNLLISSHVLLSRHHWLHTWLWVAHLRLWLTGHLTIHLVRKTCNLLLRHRHLYWCWLHGDHTRLDGHHLRRSDDDLLSDWLLYNKLWSLRQDWAYCRCLLLGHRLNDLYRLEGNFLGHYLLRSIINFGLVVYGHILSRFF